MKFTRLLVRSNSDGKKKTKMDYDFVGFYCKHCDYTFEIEWETILEIQECTHGYVGYHLVVQNAMKFLMMK